MKKKTILPMAFAAVMMFGCAGSDTTVDDTTAMDTSATMSETQSMAGTATDTEANAMRSLVIEREIVAPLATIELATLPLENPVEISEMFEDIDDTEQYRIMDLARKSPNLTTFVKLIEYANLEADIERLNDVTLFAPTNEAFAQMDRQKLEMLLMPENQAQLMMLLQAHVLPSKVSTLQFNTTQRIEYTEERYIPVDVTLNGTNVLIGGSNIVQGNVESANGFIHVMDSVIQPDVVAVENAVGY
ncbi:fasciclin domain-containing protein [Pontibacter pamirensis]|uniref:fasciclin domain-containing protein n=1 Tax=Pontibacter pamirensis TaxID=2562824 RepID=UPI00138A2A8A|nr:fasciclin domain-containing protein [Pontibacter pamirensis]